MPYVQPARKGPQPRAKVDFDVLHDTQIKVRDLAQAKGIDFRAASHGYPHFFYPDDPAPRGKYAVLELRGEHAEDTAALGGQRADGGPRAGPVGALHAQRGRQDAQGGRHARRRRRGS